MSTGLPAVGAMVAGKYRIEALLGEGGMGAVFRARHELMDKPVAIKWLHPRYWDHGEARERFVREARAAARIRHPNVLEVFDVCVEPDALFMVMELIEGETLEALLARGELSVPAALTLVLGAMRGVAEAHARGIVHRDIKPENIVVTREGVAKVVDFGISKLNDEQHGAGPVTKTGLTMGTPAFMSIEHMHGARDVDARTDVYSFGVLLYRVLTGRLPFDGETFAAIAVQVATRQPPTPKELQPDLPAYLDGIVMKAMARQRDQRFQSLNALIDALSPLASAEGFQGIMTRPGGAIPRIAGTALEQDDTREAVHSTRKLEQPVRAPEQAPRVSAPMATAPPSSTIRSKRVWPWSVGAGALVTLALLGWLGLRSNQRVARPAPPAPTLPDAAAARAAEPLPLQPASAPSPATPHGVENSEWEAPVPSAGDAASVTASEPTAAPAVKASADAGVRSAAARPARATASRDAGLEAPPAKAEPRVAPRSARIQLDQF